MIRRGEDLSDAIDRRQFVDVTTPGSIGTEFTVTHGLRFIPVGYLVIRSDKIGTPYYDGSTPWDTENIYLKHSNVNVTMRLLIF